MSALPNLSSLKIGTLVADGDADSLKEEPGKLEILTRAGEVEWMPFQSPGSPFQVRVTAFRNVTLYDGSTRSNDEYGEEEYKKFSVHDGVLTIATLHDTRPASRPTSQPTKVFNVFFLKNGSQGEPDNADQIVQRLIGHISGSGREITNRRAREKTHFANALSSQALFVAKGAHEHPSMDQSGTDQLTWWTKAMFSIVAADDMSSIGPVVSLSPLEALQFGSLPQGRRVDTRDDESFWGSDNIARAWRKHGTTTESGSHSWTEDDMINLLFFASTKKVLVNAPTYGFFFRSIKQSLLEVATRFTSWQDEAQAEQLALGTNANKWTWTMDAKTKQTYTEEFEMKDFYAKRDREERKEDLERRKMFRG